MDGSIRQILDPRVLAQSYSQVSVSDATPFVDTFWSDSVEIVDDDTYTSMYDPADLRAMPMNVPGAEARVMTVGSAAARTFNAFYTFNEMPVKGHILNALREPDSYSIQDKGRTELARLMKKVAVRQKRFKERVIRDMLIKGTVYFGNNGDILESSSGAVVTVNSDIPAGNQGNIGGIVDALWSVAGTNIFKQLDLIRDYAASLLVPIPTDIWMNAANFSYLRDNTGSNLLTYLSRNADLNDMSIRRNQAGQAVETTLLDANGFTWHFVLPYYQDKDGTARRTIPLTGAGSVVLTPPVGDWLARAKGRTLTPTSLEPVSSVDGALANITYQDGEFFYAAMEHNPLKLSVFTGDKFFFGFNQPGAVFQLTAF